MIKKYENIRDANGSRITGRTKIFIEEVDEEGEIIKCLCGDAIVPDSSGVMFIVDAYITKEVDKLILKDGDLIVKDGETIDEPEKTPEEIEREQLLARLAELDGA